ncbi:IPT/TIG domain-containing protein [Nocardia fluminea]|uniref:IPT/TIG domain-containing protein n=1 Tax=Nocardia fluminea TaxID=134984 RepID=UPI0033E138E4
MSAVTSAVPASGPATSVTITGTGFWGPTTRRFGSSATSFTTDGAQCTAIALPCTGTGVPCGHL